MWLPGCLWAADTNAMSAIFQEVWHPMSMPVQTSKSDLSSFPLFCESIHPSINPCTRLRRHPHPSPPIYIFYPLMYCTQQHSRSFFQPYVFTYPPNQPCIHQCIHPSLYPSIHPCTVPIKTATPDSCHILTHPYMLSCVHTSINLSISICLSIHRLLNQSFHLSFGSSNPRLINPITPAFLLSTTLPHTIHLSSLSWLCSTCDCVLHMSFIFQFNLNLVGVTSNYRAPTRCRQPSSQFPTPEYQAAWSVETIRWPWHKAEW